MAEERIIIAASGVRGILMIGKLLAQAGMLEGKHCDVVAILRTGDARRHANCHVIISDAPSGRHGDRGDGVIAMNLPSLDRFEGSVQPGGWLLLNSSLIPGFCRSDLRILPVP